MEEKGSGLVALIYGLRDDACLKVREHRLKKSQRSADAGFLVDSLLAEHRFHVFLHLCQMIEKEGWNV